MPSVQENFYPPLRSVLLIPIVGFDLHLIVSDEIFCWTRNPYKFTFHHHHHTGPPRRPHRSCSTRQPFGVSSVRKSTMLLVVAGHGGLASRERSLADRAICARGTTSRVPICANIRPRIISRKGPLLMLNGNGQHPFFQVGWWLLFLLNPSKCLY